MADGLTYSKAVSASTAAASTPFGFKAYHIRIVPDTTQQVWFNVNSTAVAVNSTSDNQSFPLVAGTTNTITMDVGGCTVVSYLTTAGTGAPRITAWR